MEDAEEEVDQRLARLAARRRAAAAVHRSSSSDGSDSDDEGSEAQMPPHRGAVLALRELLQERQGVFDGVAAAAGGSSIEAPAPPTQQDDTPGRTSPLPTTASRPGSRATTPLFPQHVARPGSSGPMRGSTGSHAMSARAGPSRPGTAGGSAPGPAATRPASRPDACTEPTAAVCGASLHAERADLAALLARQQAAAAERERQRREREAQLQQARLELATHHMAAWRIARARRRFLASPGRLRDVAAAVRLQAAWRGWASRRRTAALLQRHRQRLALLGQLRTAAQAGDLAGARAAAAQLQPLGCVDEPARLVAGLELRAAEAVQTLQQAAGQGTAEEYEAALAAAQRYRHVAAAVQEAAGVLAARVAAAEQAVEAAVEGGTLVQCREAMAAAAALAVDQAILQAAEQRVLARNQQTAAALQAALEASPFSAQAYGSCLERAGRFGMHAEVARAQRGLQLRRHRAASALPQLTASGGAAEVEAACSEAAQLSLEQEAQAAMAQLEQRRAAAASELQQAATAGSLEQYKAAAQQAAWLGVAQAEQQACGDQLRWRQQEVEQRLLQAAEYGDAAAARERSQAALLLGLADAVGTAERRVNERRQAAVQQLAASTRAACEPAAAAEAEGAKELQHWLSAAQQLESGMASLGAAAALAQPPAACSAWPAKLRGWLECARQAASLELEAPVATAAATLRAHFEAQLAAAQVVCVPLLPAQLPSSACESASRRCSSLESSRAMEAAAEPAPSPRLPGPAARVLANLQEWRAMQQGMAPLVAALAAEAAEDGERGQAEAQSARAGGACALDVSCQGLRSLELLAGSCSLTHLDISSNAISSLEALSALHALRELRAGSNQLASLAGVQALRQLTALEAAANRLEQLPSLEGLPALRRLDLSANHLTPAALLAAGLPAAGARLTSLRLGGNPLGDVASWAGPMPCLLHLDLSGGQLASLEGLAAAAPLLQVLVASRNRLTALPPAMHLPLLRELWLGGNRLAAVPAWPWLPSLRVLRLEDNQLAWLAPLQGLAQLQALDLSFNRLAGLQAVLGALAPVAGTLRQLRLNDNPLAAAAAAAAAADAAEEEWREGDGGVQQQTGYGKAVLRALPLLEELDSQPVDAPQRPQLVQAVRRRQAAGQGSQACCSEQEWEVQTALWLLGDSGAAELVQQVQAQQEAVSAAAALQATERWRGVETGAAGLAAALAGLQRAAAAGNTAALLTPTPLPAAATASSLQTLWQAQQLYELLLSDPATAQALLLLDPSGYQQRLACLHAAATAIQASWRRCAARHLLQQLAAARWQQRREAAATCIQAALRGWACRLRSHGWVQARLAAWRGEWREAQRQLLELQQSCAATRIQAAWRGSSVRRLLARARLALRQQQRQEEEEEEQQLVPSGSWDAEGSCLSLEGLLEGGASAALAAFDAPEALQSELFTAAAPQQLQGGTGAALGARGWPLLKQPPAPLPSASAAAGALPPLVHTSPQPPAAPGGAAGEAGWSLADPAAAAAYQQLRQKQAAALRRQELRQALKDPLERLHHFRHGGGSHSGSGGLVLPALQASPPSPRASAATAPASAGQCRPAARGRSSASSASSGGAAAPCGRRGSGPGRAGAAMPALRPRTLQLDGC